MKSKAIELATALAPLGATILGALSKLFGGATDSDAQVIWATVEEEVFTTRTRLASLGFTWSKRDDENNTRVG